MLVAVCCLLWPAMLAAGHGEETALERIREEIDVVEARIRSLEGKREGFLGELHHLDLQLERQKKHLDRLELERADSRAALNRCREETEHLEARLVVERRALAERFASLYRLGRLSYMRLFLSADSAGVMRERLRYLSYLAGRDSRLIQACLQTLDELERQRAELAEHESRLAKNAEEAERRQEALLRLRKDKGRLLRQLEASIEVHQRIAAELEQAAGNLETLFGTLDGAATTAADRARLLPGLDRHRGLLPWPARGKIVGRYGRKRHPRFGTTTISNGIVLDLPAGTPANAVYFGSVVYNDWLHGYGKLVILNHGGESYSLYAHLESSFVTVGDWLNKGDRLGATGASGSLGGPALYFELRIGGEPVDPLRWLER